MGKSITLETADLAGIQTVLIDFNNKDMSIAHVKAENGGPPQIALIYKKETPPTEPPALGLLFSHSSQVSNIIKALTAIEASLKKHESSLPNKT